VTVQQTDVPAFRPGTLFREVVSGTRTLPGSANSGPSTQHVSSATAAKALKAERAVKAAKAVKPAKTAKVAKIEPKGKGTAQDLSKAAKKASTRAADKK
jgi:DNA-binding protein HU-beta